VYVNQIFIIFILNIIICNILETSTGAFYIKISRIFSVSRSILGMPTFREPCSPFHQCEQSELFLRDINKHANKTRVSDTQSDERILFILPYVKGTIDQIGRILNKHNIRTIFKSPKNIMLRSDPRIRLFRREEGIRRREENWYRSCGYRSEAGATSQTHLIMSQMWINALLRDLRLCIHLLGQGT